MEGGTLYAGAEGLEELFKARSVVAWRERQQRTGVDYSGVYFCGMVSGLALPEALDATLSFSVASSITEHGCKVEAPHSGQAR